MRNSFPGYRIREERDPPREAEEPRDEESPPDREMPPLDGEEMRDEELGALGRENELRDGALEGAEMERLRDGALEGAEMERLLDGARLTLELRGRDEDVFDRIDELLDRDELREEPIEGDGVRVRVVGATREGLGRLVERGGAMRVDVRGAARDGVLVTGADCVIDRDGVEEIRLPDERLPDGLDQ